MVQKVVARRNFSEHSPHSIFRFVYDHVIVQRPVAFDLQITLLKLLNQRMLVHVHRYQPFADIPMQQHNKVPTGREMSGGWRFLSEEKIVSFVPSFNMD
jgi:hypothetical protein